MSDSDKEQLNWDFKLTFDEPESSKAEAVKPPEIPPREVVKEKCPRVLYSIEMLWGTTELHQYLGKTLFTDRNNRQGFPPDVMSALMKIYAEHTQILKAKGLAHDDVWDL